MWKVKLSAPAEKQVKELIKKGEISDDDRRVIASWIRTVEKYGPVALSRQGLWSDHALHSEWEGYRASAYSRRGRIIYQVIDDQVVVVVVRITPDHDYRKDDS